MSIKIENIIIGALLFFLAFTLGMAFFANMLNEYSLPSTAADQFGNVTDKTTDLRTVTNNMRTKVQNKEVSSGTAEDDIIKGVSEATRRNPYTAMEVSAQGIEEIGKQLSHVIPAVVITFVGAALSIIVIMSVVYLFWRYSPR